jgi:uncharacterized protein YjbI with pentapeptide repeats
MARSVQLQGAHLEGADLRTAICGAPTCAAPSWPARNSPPPICAKRDGPRAVARLIDPLALRCAAPNWSAGADLSGADVRQRLIFMRRRCEPRDFTGALLRQANFHRRHRGTARSAASTTSLYQRAREKGRTRLRSFDAAHSNLTVK